ncbi:ribose-phosphate pyrophosphokinase [Fusibacter bizertensis]|jgi:ribose-phosphate pyrophosphokinase|uniref:ribose-phosphate diphosphokinase n=1 Tax=Fusibacter bizertensis TaxID=1488331 RepID=A0ABT6NA50_9FIRM|nr:ribose-phosphate pyrophosphokinase [Fusibacter bizertensis]MDH8677302.1 ribose-phosphate pyrophosphokinase [Fusibacter bizertensis]
MRKEDLYKHIQFGELGLIVMDNCDTIGKCVNDHLLEMRRTNFEDEHTLPESYIIQKKEVRFSNGEGKIFLEESVRGKDIYIITDIGNYDVTYTMYGFENRKSPDDHIQDIKRVLSAMAGKARRITLMMPLLYASRQHSRKGRESLDCAMALQELEKLGVNDILTFDAHDPTIQNAVPLISFENLYPTLDIVKRFITDEKELFKDPSKMLLISPDTGAMDRAVYYSGVLGFDIGLFYKRRDHSRVVKGKNPIVQHEYIGKDVKDCNILIVDDMIASGESVFDIALELKKRQAGKIFVATTYALFTEGIEKFNSFYEQGLIDRLYTTNLSYVPEAARQAPWFAEVDMSEFMGRIINRLNFDQSISDLIDTKKSINDLLKFAKSFK